MKNKIIVVLGLSLVSLGLYKAITQTFGLGKVTGCQMIMRGIYSDLGLTRINEVELMNYCIKKVGE